MTGQGHVPPDMFKAVRGIVSGDCPARCRVKKKGRGKRVEGGGWRVEGGD